VSETLVPEKALSPASTRRRSDHSMPFVLAAFPLLVLFAAAVLLFWLSESKTEGAFRYWEIFIPIVALVSLGSGWSQAYLSGNSRIWYLVKQAVHWGALIALLYLLNTHGIRALMNAQQYTAVLIYLLAFGTVLAALHMDLKLLVFGLFLAFCAYVIAVPTANPALGMIGNILHIPDAQTNPTTASLWVAGIGLVASLFVLVMMRAATMSKRASAARNGA
jgi:hypothetical protein